MIAILAAGMVACGGDGSGTQRRASDTTCDAVEVDLPRERFPAEIEASSYFIVAEALTNIVKHAHAESAAVSAVIDDEMLRVEVRDDGIGGADPSGPGLVGISDRVTALGGRFNVESPAGGGTVLTATLPISAVPADAG